MASYNGQVNDMPIIPLTNSTISIHTSKNYLSEKSYINKQFLIMIGQPEYEAAAYLGQTNDDFITLIETPIYATAYAKYLGIENTIINDAFTGMLYAENYHEWTGTDFIGVPNNINIDLLEYTPLRIRNIEPKLKGQLWPKIGGLTRYGKPW